MVCCDVFFLTNTPRPPSDSFFLLVNVPSSVFIFFPQDKKDDSKFCIQHPKKSFTVSAKTVWNKKAWMAAITGASDAALRARMEG